MTGAGTGTGEPRVRRRGGGAVDGDGEEDEDEDEESWGEFDFGVSEGFDALQWFKKTFIKCNERAAALVKTWLPASYLPSMKD
ncbi:hypothetical protein D9758_011111 [Tetrapyrgos nigripes]|uniref:Uncharacterized protein n=1 Tax=Tetrapyrgos nigripes TaxID=182062 RepID=A0A8H5FNA0_9AGAR|nr:hypothetical protein D9758_011111 [Tetrapyrgos nigripes]